jgi:alpha-L-fucosidase
VLIKIISEIVKMSKAKFFIPCMVFVVMLLANSNAQTPLSASSENQLKPLYTADWESLKKHNPAPEWFRDAKFGIYFHWGVYSVPAFGSEWYPRNMHNKSGDNRNPGPSLEYKNHVAKYGEPTEFGYHDFVPMFKAEKFDADEWAELFKKAGARFAGLVAEHHDGYSMWASKLTPWNVKDIGPKRDITGELARAIRKRGMKFVTTFHHARNNLWEHQNRDGAWSGHYSYLKRDFPSLLEDPKNAILYGYMPREEFLQMWKGKLIEVIDNYQPDLMWFDSWLDEIPDQTKMEYLAHYFNKTNEWGKEVVVTFKQEDLPREVALDDYEKGRAAGLTDFIWLTDDTISKGSWCYTDNLQIKSTAEVLRTFIDIVSKNGQLLLNISPMADGTIPENQKQILLDMGRRLSKYGEAIYETRPFVEFGEGPTRLEKGGWFVNMKGAYGAEDIRYTRKGDTVYAIVLGWPGENKAITMTMFAQDGKAKDVKVTNVSMLGTNERIKWERRDSGLIVTTPGRKADDLAIVFKLGVSN